MEEHIWFQLGTFDEFIIGAPTSASQIGNIAEEAEKLQLTTLTSYIQQANLEDTLASAGDNNI